MVADTMFLGFLERRDLVLMFLTPVTSSTARDRTACDQAGTFRSGTHQHAAGAINAYYLVGNGCTLQGNLHQVLLCVLNALADCIRHFGSLAQAEAYGAVAVADYNQRGELENTTTLNSLGNTVNGDYSFLQFHVGSVNSSQKYPSYLRI